VIPGKQVLCLYIAVAGLPELAVQFSLGRQPPSAGGRRAPQVERFGCQAASLAASGQEQKTARSEKTADAFEQRKAFSDRKVVDVVVKRRDVE